MSIRDVRSVDAVDRPIATKNLSGIGNFLGLYGGEHIAATEFVFGATLVSWGCSAKEIIIGLLLGNALAVLSFTLCTATMGSSTRLTLYSYLKKILGPWAQKFYALVWGVCSIVLASSGVCVSATAIREVVGVPIQREWYPTHIGFVAIVVVLGIVITLIAANGFDAVSKFSSCCVPWMIIAFFIGAVVALPVLSNLTGAPIGSFKDIWNVFSSNVGITANPDATPITWVHVMCFAWLCNLAWHMGLNDMGLFRYAKNAKYGFVTAIGMYVGHFFAWIMVAVMGAAASAVLQVALPELDPGAVTNTVFGLTGIAAVVIAGFTTANPTVYRSALSLNIMFPKMSQKKLTYIIGILMTILACFPAMTDIGDIVSILGWAVVGVGAIVLAEHFVFPKIGYTRHWAMYKGLKINWAACITWAISIVFVVAMKMTGALHHNFIFIPEYIIAFVLYIILAGLMGAKGDYSKEEAEELKFEEDLQKYVDEEAEKEFESANANKVHKGRMVEKVFPIISYVILALIVVIALMNFFGSMDLEAFKIWAFVLTLIYFGFAGTAKFVEFKNEAVTRD